MENITMENIGEKLVEGIKFLNDIVFSKFAFQHGLTHYNFLMDFLFFKTPLAMFGMHYAVLGGKCEFLEIELQPNKMYCLDMTDTVKNGKIVYINYTPHGKSLFPIQMHGNVPMLEINSPIINIYPVPMEKSELLEPTKVSIMYWYFEKNILRDVIENNLIKGFEDYQKGYYELMAEKLQTAIEVFLAQCVKKFILRFQITKEEIEKNRLYRGFYLKQKYGIPYMAQRLRAPMLNEQVLSDFGKLVKKRNEIMHEGRPKHEITKQEATTYIASTFVYYKYLKLFYDIEQ